MHKLLATLAELDVRIEVRNGRLHVNARPGVLTPELQSAISKHKEQVIERLQVARAADSTEELPRIQPDAQNRFAPFPLNDTQHAYWIGRSSHLELGNVSTHAYFEFDCERLERQRLGQALNRVIAHHDMLRAVIDADGRQHVLPSVPEYRIAEHDVRSGGSEQEARELARIRAEMAAQVHAADCWPLFEIRLMQIGEARSVLCVSWDFLVVDAWSVLIIFRQWRALYDDPNCALPPVNLFFRDYVLAEKQLRERPSFLASKQYWWERIDTLPAGPELPIRQRSRTGERLSFGRRGARLSRANWDAIKARGRSTGLTPSSVLLAAFCEVLDLWSRMAHYTLNLTLFNRLPLHPEVGEVVGDFTSLMLLEIAAERGPSFVERVRAVQKQFLQDFEHRRVSAVEVARELVKRRGEQRRALFPVVFTSTLALDGGREEYGKGLEQFGTLRFGISQTPQVWLDYQIFDVGGELVFNWDCVEELFPPGVLDAMFDANRTLLEALARDPQLWDLERPVGLPESQRARRAAVNATGSTRFEQCMYEPFIARALQHPDAIAVESGDGRMSYGELLARSAALAECLIAEGAGRDQLVAVVLGKGWKQLVGVLAVQIAGAAYLPVDPRWPELRRAQVMSQGGVRLAVTNRMLDAHLAWPAGIRRLTVDAECSPSETCVAPRIRNSPEDLAYVIFTSGSSGKPKGVAIDHRSAMNTVGHLNEMLAIGAADKVLAVSDLSFDLSVYDIFGLLAAGGTVVMPEVGVGPDASRWLDLLEAHRVTVWNSAPQLMNMLVERLDEARDTRRLALRWVLLSGDWIPVALPTRITAHVPGARVMSLGGATEGSIWSIHHPIDSIDPEWDSIPYGKPLPNQHIYVLNSRLEMSPDFVTGDLYIGGAGVALGYWNDPVRTDDQFIVHPKTGERLYRTGDLGRVHADGTIEFLGREDSQVKVRGHRVELGEIAATIRTYPGVRDAVVLHAKLSGRGAPVAYVVVSRERERSGGRRVDAESEERSRHEERMRRVAGECLSAANAPAIEAFAEIWEKLQHASLAAMRETLESLGIAEDGSAPGRIEQLIAERRLKAEYRPLIERWRALIRQQRGASGQSVSDLLQACAQLGDAAGPALRDFVAFTTSVFRSHAQLLSAERSPLELLFPDGDWRYAEALYETNPVVEYHNEVIARLVAAIAESSPPDRNLRVLEIGAGIGATSTRVLPRLPADRTEYAYGDVTPYFFARAKEKFRRYPFVQWILHDINCDPRQQTDAARNYDVIIASNVLHNARDIDASIGYVRDMLKPGGCLLLLEGTLTSAWQWATVGFLEAEGSGVEMHLSSADTLENARSWAATLARNGFEAVQIVPDAGECAAHPRVTTAVLALPQHVLLARRPVTDTVEPAIGLRDYLAERLPEYMLPHRVIFLDRLPISTNGKVDFAALPREAESVEAGRRQIAAPRTARETEISAIWKEVLGVESVSVTDNFFEIGGDSLLLTEVLRRLNATAGRTLGIAELFSHPTVRSLAEYLNAEVTPAPATVARSAKNATVGAKTRDIAVVGMAGRFPDANDVDALWENLARGHCACREFNEQELRDAGVSDAELEQKDYVRAGPAFSGLRCFDSAFFSITPRDAQIMDPQQRMLLECAVHALEHAGYPGERGGNRIGVFVGKSTSRYLFEHVLPDPDALRDFGIQAVLNLNEKDHAATFISYKLGLSGPSINVNTACSTSLVGVHAACQSLLMGECELALAGGVSVVSTLERAGYLYHEGHILSRNGKCRPFADDADGCVFGSGVGLVVLKPLARAIEDRDTIHAVIKGSAINNDGALKVGYSAPSLQGQAAVITAALQNAGVEPGSIQYVEAHGTATHLGDPIEFGALRRVFGGRTVRGALCALGSIKSNIGHLDSAAGVAGLIKVVQALKHRRIPPTLHAQVPNRRIDLQDSPFYLSSEMREWSAAGGARRAGVSSFGVGGTNVHVVLEEAPQSARDAAVEHQGELILLSARDEAALHRNASALASHLDRSNARLEDIAFTTQVGRIAHGRRAFVVAATPAEAASRLRATGGPSSGFVRAGADESICFIFPGQGALRPGVTYALYRSFSEFSTALDECAQFILDHAGWDLRAALYEAAANADAGRSTQPDLGSTAIAQPTLFAIEYATARLWQSLGVEPAGVLGHSLGEYVAACLAGVFSWQEALALVIVRGRLLEGVPPGGMLAVSGAESEVRELLEGSACDLAAVNSPGQCVVAGPLTALERLEHRATSRQLTCRRLPVSRAFHSAAMDPVLDVFEKCVSEVEKSTPRIPLLSGVTGGWMTDAEACSSAYWARQIRQPVRFAGMIETLRQARGGLVLEVGPGRTLSALATACGMAPEQVVATFGADASVDDRRHLLHGAGRLWVAGVELQWERLHESRRPGRVPLPGYSFEKREHWIERRANFLGAAPAASQSTAAGRAVSSPVAASQEAVPAGPELNATQTRLVQIWREFLGIEGIGLRDNFFELGGDSLLATRVYARVREEFGVDVPVRKMFEFPTIHHLNLFIRASRERAGVEALSEEELNELLAIMES